MRYVRTYTCEEGHQTRGEYANSEAFEKVMSLKLASCALCGSTAVIPDPPRPYTNTGVSREIDNQRIKMRDVGEKFADEARAIHRGQKPPEAIRGVATGEQVYELASEGVPFIARPAGPKLN